MTWFRRRTARVNTEGLVDSQGGVRGYHGGCPAVEPPFFGGYTLVFDSEAHVACSACGAHDLTAKIAVEARNGKGRQSDGGAS